MTATSIKRTEELRKLQLTGGSTYIISLPKKWIALNQLKKNNTLIVRTEDDGSLSVMPPDLAKQEKPQEAHIASLPKRSARPLDTQNGFYVLGWLQHNAHQSQGWATALSETTHRIEIFRPRPARGNGNSDRHANGTDAASPAKLS